jgi:hypothetical protein
VPTLSLPHFSMRHFRSPATQIERIGPIVRRPSPRSVTSDSLEAEFLIGPSELKTDRWGRAMDFFPSNGSSPRSSSFSRSSLAYRRPLVFVIWTIRPVYQFVSILDALWCWFHFRESLWAICPKSFAHMLSESNSTAAHGLYVILHFQPKVLRSHRK